MAYDYSTPAFDSELGNIYAKILYALTATTNTTTTGSVIDFPSLSQSLIVDLTGAASGTGESTTTLYGRAGQGSPWLTLWQWTAADTSEITAINVGTTGITTGMTFTGFTRVQQVRVDYAVPSITNVAPTLRIVGMANPAFHRDVV